MGEQESHQPTAYADVASLFMFLCSRLVSVPQFLGDQFTPVPVPPLIEHCVSLNLFRWQ